MKRAALAVMLVGCTASETSSRESQIIGPSHAAALGELPATGALLTNALGYPGLLCTATLIAPNVVLTAAHCVDHDAVPDFTLERYARDPAAATIHRGASMVAHPNWTSNVPPGQLGQANDIGLVFLQEPITDVAPARLARTTDAIPVGLAVTLSGYGYADDYDHDAGVPGYEYKRVGDSHVTMVGDHEVAVMMVNDAGACNGDSGGPAYAMIGGRQRIAATVSRGLGFMDCTLGGVFTRVDPYVAWIETQVSLPCSSGSSPDCAPGDDAGVPDAPDDDDPAETGEGGGCGCSGGAPVSGWLVIVIGLALARRRFRRRSS